MSDIKEGLEYLNELSKTFLIVLQNEYESVQNIFEEQTK